MNMTEELRESSSTGQLDADALFNFEGATKPRGRCQPVMEQLQRCALHISRPLSALIGRRPSNAFGILLYHRITSITPNFSEPTINVTPSRLRSQLSGLLARGYQAWPLARVLRHRCAGKIVPRNVFVVTFDDGFANNYTQALPILRDLNVPATIFLATTYLDSEQPFPFDRWEGAGVSAERQSWQALTTDQCADMLDGGLIEIGAHTHT